MTRPLMALAALLALAACGQRAELTPHAGTSLPPAAYGAPAQATTAELLTPPPEAAPVRSVELRTRSEPREDDPFDLPPE